MDICVLNPYFYPYAGGTEKVLYNIYSRLSKRHSITVVTSAGEGEDASVDYVNGIKVIRLKTTYVPIGGFPLPFQLMHGINDVISASKSDIYHINNRFLYYGSTVRAMRRTGGKLVLTIHNALPKNIDLLTDMGGAFYDALLGRKMMAAADAIVGVSRATVLSTVPEPMQGKSSVITNGVDSSAFMHRDKKAWQVARVTNSFYLPKRVVMSNGRLVRQKGQRYLLEGFSGIDRKGTGLIVIGRGPMKNALDAHAAALGLRGSYWNITGISEEDLPYFYNASDIYVLPSLYEPASVSLMEAMASEMPIIATRVGGNQEILNGSGYTVEPMDPDAIGKGITRIIENPKEARQKARKARSLAVRDHDWGKISSQYEKLFQKLSKR